MSDALPSWIELAVAVAFAGAAWSAPFDYKPAGRRRALVCAALALTCTVAAWIESARSGPDAAGGFRLLAELAGEGAFAVDSLNAPLLPLTTLLALVVVVATSRSKVRRFSFARVLVLEALLLLATSARAPGVLIVLLALSALPLVQELRATHHSSRVLVLHVATSFLLMGAGWLLVSGSPPAGTRASSGYALIAAGIAVRSGLVPAHCWVLDLFDRGSLGSALVLLAPLTGAYAAARLLHAEAADGAALGLTVLALVTALYCAAMSVVQSDARRFFCQLFSSLSALVLAGVTLRSPLGVTAALHLWLSVSLAAAGLGLTLRALEARTGRLTLDRFHGFHTQTPTLAALFLITGLAAVGFPGTVGFFGIEMLTDALARESKVLALVVVLALAIDGIVVLRAYTTLFLGAGHPVTVDLRVRRSELIALLLLVGLLLGGTVWPQPGMDSRKAAADALLETGRPG